MKIDAKVRMREAKGTLDAGQLVTIPVDLDYVSDYDDVVQEVENEFYNRYGFSAYCNVDFDIENASELAEEAAFDEFKSKTQYSDM